MTRPTPALPGSPRTIPAPGRAGRGYETSRSQPERLAPGPWLWLLSLWLLLSLWSWVLSAPPAYAEEPPAATATAIEPPSTSAPAPAPAPAPTPATQPGETDTHPDASGGGVSGPRDGEGTDGGALLNVLIPRLGEPSWMASAFSYTIGTWLRGVNADFGAALKRFCCDSLNFVTRTPPDLSYASPTVLGLWRTSRAIANAALALVVLWGGFNVVVRDHLGSPYHAAMELFPRVALGALLANTSLLWGQLAIDANDALCQALGQASLPAWDGAASWDRAVIGLLVGLVYLVMGLLLLLQQLARLALVDILLVLAPLGLLCWVLPQTQGWAHLWSQTFAAAVFTQFVQAVALKVGASLIVDYSETTADATIISLFLGIAVLGLTLKIPSLLRAGGGGGLGFVGYYLYSRGGRALDGGLSGLRGARGGTSETAPMAAQLPLPSLAARAAPQPTGLWTRWRSAEGAPTAAAPATAGAMTASRDAGTQRPAATAGAGRGAA